MLKLSGVMPALVTPFDAEGQIDFVAFKAHIEALRAAGVSGWVPCGSSGEYNFMSDEERDSVLKFVKDFAKPGEILIAGTNAPSTAGVIANTLRGKTKPDREAVSVAPGYGPGARWCRSARPRSLLSAPAGNREQRPPGSVATRDAPERWRGPVWRPGLPGTAPPATPWHPTPRCDAGLGCSGRARARSKVRMHRPRRALAGSGASLRCRRHQSAKHQAISSVMPTSAMLASGFNTKSNFNREFLRVTGETPSAYRARVAPL